MYKYVPKSTRDPTASLLGRFSSADSLYRQSKHQFLKIHPINQTDNLQNSIKETTNSRETAMALKASTHTHRQLFFLPQNPMLPPLQPLPGTHHTIFSLPDQHSWMLLGQGPAPLGESREGAVMHEAHGKERPFATSRMRHNSILREWI